MGRSANFSVVLLQPGISVTIRDDGPWDRHLTITNDADDVVARLSADGTLTPGMRLFYFDSEGSLDEIIVRDGKVEGFRPGPGRKEGK